jgi:hypothetical protein
MTCCLWLKLPYGTGLACKALVRTVFHSVQDGGVERNFRHFFAIQTSIDVSIHNCVAGDSILQIKGSLQSYYNVHFDTNCSNEKSSRRWPDDGLKLKVTRVRSYNSILTTYFSALKVQHEGLDHNKIVKHIPCAY